MNDKSITLKNGINEEIINKFFKNDYFIITIPIVFPPSIPLSFAEFILYILYIAKAE